MDLEDEYEEDLGSRPLRQGDLFLWSEDNYQRPWQSYGLIVTADCDIARNKIRGRISYIPGFITEDYIWHFWMTGRFDSTLKSLLTKLTNKINKRLSIVLGRESKISTDAVQAWAERSSGEEIATEIGITDRGQISEMSKTVDQIRTLLKLSQSENPDLELLKRSYSIKTNTSFEEGCNALNNDFKGSLGSLPGDVFLLPKLEGGSRHGIFFLLRHITQCEMSDVTIRPDDIRFGNAKAHRIGRVASPYKYAVLQNLARVFTDIGLPDHYKARCGESADSFFVLGDHK